MPRPLVALGIVVLALVALASPARAHAALESTEPAAGAILDAPPDAVTLHFTARVHADDDAVNVFDATGEPVETGDVEQVDDRTVRVALDGIGSGGYVVAWKVASADGHPINGAFTWRVDDASSVADPAADAPLDPVVDPAVVADLLEDQQAGRAVGVAAGIVRFVVFGAILVLVGGLAFVAFVWVAGATERRVRRLLWASLVALATGTVLGIGLQGASLDGLGLTDALQPSVLGDAVDTTFGTVWLARLALLAPMAWVLTQLRHAGRAWWRVNAVVLGVAIAATPAFAGHADSGRWTALAKVADVAHVVAAAVWLGGLTVLVLRALRRDVPEARTVAERFSPIAFTAVGVVVVTGSFQSVRQVTSLDGIETTYGRLLAVKIVLVLALIGVASLTRSALRGRLALDEGEPVTEERTMGVLRRLVVAEVVVAIVVVAVTSLLVDADPGGAGAGSSGPFDETVVVDDVLINVVAVPGTVGPTDIHLYVDDPAGGLTPPVGATGTLSSGETPGIEVPFVAAGPGHWSAHDVDVPVAGQWQLTIDVQLTEVDEVSTTFTIPIGGTS